MAVLLHRWGVFAVRRCRTVLTVWLLVVTAIAALGVAFAGSFDSRSDIPGSAAQSALERMDHHFGSSVRQSAEIVFEAPEGSSFKDLGNAAALKRTLSAAATVPGVTSVSDPMRGRTVTPDARTAVAQVEFSVSKDEDVPADDLNALKDTAAGSRAAGIEVLFGGDAYKESSPPVGPMEGVGVLVALAVLVITFGSMLSAGMPLLTALIAVVASMTGLMGLSSVLSVSDKAPTLAIMLGLAVGIDYALFIVSRHRSELAQGRSVKDAAARATATAGSAVAFAGLTVIIALAGLTVAGVPVLTSMGLSAAAAVAVAVVMSLGLLPALLALAGERLRPKPGSRAEARMRDAADPMGKPSMGARWVAGAVRRPWRVVITVTLALAALALPATRLQLALSDDGSEPASAAVRQTYDKIGDAFGPGANGPLMVLVTNAPSGTLKTTGQEVAQDLAGVQGIARVSPVDYSGDGAAARVQVIPDTGPRDPATAELVTVLRDRVALLAARNGADIAVTGQTAVSPASAMITVSPANATALPAVAVARAVALLILRIGLRSLRRMADTADDIASGARDERLPVHGAHTETDRLAVAVNNAFDAQARAETQIRDFAADASHELRTPLATISGWLDLYNQGGLSAPADLDRALERVDGEVGRMRLLVEELSLLARLDAGRPLNSRPVDLRRPASAVVQDAQVVAPDRVIDLNAPVPASVHGDQPRLQQVLNNLLGNAIQHTPSGTTIGVTVEPTATHVRIRVTDHGPGIPAGDLARVFDRFWRADAGRGRAHGGSGLGLAIVQAIVRAHHGTVHVSSAPGTGTTVTVTLPTQGGRDEPPTPPTTDRPDAP
ncbi:MMPL family transporter [Streptomyces sp. NBC_00872]|uniref:MMPL family transporter n=1 Tax=Streptomyces sp. NBC_00872 TaxID=2903686 RepID=UPI00386CBD5E|nr:MMPL family transporter [Streptomyces sp. NBC_00872]